MTLVLYLTQVAVIGGGLSLLLRDKHWILRVQVLLWTLATAAIAVRYGLVEQLNFYSNDQRYYRDIVQVFADDPWLADADWWLSGSRMPFTLPAVLLYGVGVDPTLALKGVALACLLWMTSDLLNRMPSRQGASFVFSILVMACGTIGIFYAALALRETMMMLFVTRFLTTESPAIRALIGILLFLLRPHLAVSLFTAALLVWIWKLIRNQRSESPGTLFGMVIVGTLIGYSLFGLGTEALQGVSVVQGHQWGIQPVTRIASNYLGLQFLTAQSETMVFSLASLVVARLVLVETILTPTLFTAYLFLRSRWVRQDAVIALLAFAIYLGLVTNTDFNSFRQNIPFMPIMGLTIARLTSQADAGRFSKLGYSAPQSVTSA